MSQKSGRFPFYAHPMDKKRSVQIIKEVKAEIRKLESNRPITPLDRKISTFMSVEHQNLSRPLSSSSICSINYELEENVTTCQHNNYTSANHILKEKSQQGFVVHSLSTEKVKHKSYFSDDDQKLQPIVVKPLSLHRRASNATSKLLKEKLFTGFPPIDYIEKASGITAIDSSGIGKPKDNDFVDKEPFSSNDEIVSSKEVNDFVYKKELIPMLQSQSDELETVDTKTKKYVDETENEDESKDLSKGISVFLPVLERNAKSGKYKSEEEIIDTIEKIHAYLSDKEAFLINHENRIPLLKLLFKFLNSNYPILTLHAVNLLLDMKVSGRNLENVFKIILKIVKDKNIKLKDYLAYESFVERLSAISVESNYQASLFGLQVIKNLLENKVLDNQQQHISVQVMFHHLAVLSLLLSSKSVLDRRYNEFILLVLSMLKFLSEDENLFCLLIEVETLNEILLVLRSTYENIDLVGILVRLFGKIVENSAGCETLSQCSDELLLSFLTVLETYKYHIDITLQTTFIITNLVSVNCKTAVMFVTCHNFINTMVVLGEYINEHLQLQDSLSDCFKSSNQSSGDRNWQIDIFEVILKILCIWANVCLYPEAGQYLVANHSILTHLLGVVDAFVENNEGFNASLALHSLLVVINNISYYLETNTELCVRAAESIIPLLDDELSLEVRLEAVYIVRNLSRSANVRLFIQENSLFPALIKLVSVEDREFSIGAYAVIMNLLMDEGAKKTFDREDGVTRVLHKLHLCADRDWETCAVLCQILWNYYNAANTDSINISKLEIRHLIKFLSSTSKETEPRSYNSEWVDEYYPVASKLLNLLKTKESIE